MYLYIWYCLTKDLTNNFTDFSPTGTGHLTGTGRYYNFHLDTLLCLTLPVPIPDKEKKLT